MWHDFGQGFTELMFLVLVIWIADLCTRPGKKPMARRKK